MVVDSPPGTMAPARPFNSSTVLTSTGSTPSRRNISACSWTSPWSARMPTLGLSSPLPATRREPPLFFEVPPLPPAPCLAHARAALPPVPARRREPLLFFEVPHLRAAHRLAQAPARLGHGLRVLVVSSRLHDGPRPRGRVPALEDATPDEHAVGPKLHHERRVRRRGDASCGEQHDRQPPVLCGPPHQLVGRPELLGLAHKLIHLQHA